MKRKRITQAVAILIAALIPAFYAFVYLSAYWDPSSRMSSVSIAVVNEDAGALVNGVQSNIGGTLVENLKTKTDIHWVFTQRKEAEDGVLNEKYYAELVIPSDFTQRISSAAESDGATQGVLYFKSNDKLGTTASTMMSTVSSGIESSVSKSITESLVDALAGKLLELPDSLQKLSDALSLLQDGSAQLGQGLDKLTQGQSEFNKGLGSLADGLNGAAGGGKTLSDALRLLTGKSGLFADALAKNGAGAQSLAGYSGQFNGGLQTLSGSLDSYINTSAGTIKQCMAIVSYLKKYVADHPESANDPSMRQILSALGAMSGGGTTDITAAAATLTAALDRLTASYTQINAAVQKLPAGLKTAATSAEALSKGITQLSSGASTLRSGLDTAAQGAKTLNDKTPQLLSAEQQLLDGANRLNDGLGQAKSSVDDSIHSLQSSRDALRQYGAFAANPVKMETSRIGEAKNTGAAMAPFMLSLCLWLGGIMLVIIFTTMDKMKFEPLRSTPKTLVDLGLFRFQLLAALQAVCLAFTAVTLLGLPVDNAVQFYGICLLGGITFITVIQVLVLAFRDAGKLLAIIFMLLQITAGGGILSMELVPPFFSAIHPYMPMTYTITAFRNSILGMDSSSYNGSVGVLFATLGVGVVLVTLMSMGETLYHRVCNQQTRIGMRFRPKNDGDTL